MAVAMAEEQRGQQLAPSSAASAAAAAGDGLTRIEIRPDPGAAADGDDDALAPAPLAEVLGAERWSSAGPEIGRGARRHASDAPLFDEPADREAAPSPPSPEPLANAARPRMSPWLERTTATEEPVDRPAGPHAAKTARARAAPAAARAPSGRGGGVSGLAAPRFRAVRAFRPAGFGDGLSRTSAQDSTATPFTAPTQIAAGGRSGRVGGPNISARARREPPAAASGNDWGKAAAAPFFAEMSAERDDMPTPAPRAWGSAPQHPLAVTDAVLAVLDERLEGAARDLGILVDG